MDKFTMHTLAITFCIIVGLFAISATIIMLRDGNTALVQSVTNSIMWVLVSSIVGIAGAVIGKDISAGWAQRTTTTVTTASPTIVSPQATIVQQKEKQDESTIATP